MDSRSDENIAVSVQAGDAELFGVLIERYEDKLKRYGRKFLNNAEDIEDMVQEIFIKCYTNIQSFDASLRFSPWIYRIAHNTFVNALKKKQRLSFIAFDTDRILPFIVARETSDDLALSKEIEKEMDEVIAQVPQKYREVLVLFYYQELTYQEISDILRVPVTTVGVRINRGRTKLRELYEVKYVKE